MKNKPKIVRLDSSPTTGSEIPKRLQLKRSVQHEIVPQDTKQSLPQPNQQLSVDQKLEQVLEHLVNGCDLLTKLLYIKQYRPESQYTALFPDFAGQAQLEFRKLLMELRSQK